MQTKICTKCNIEKEINNFYVRHDNNKHRNACKECIKINIKKWIKNNLKHVQKRRHNEYLLNIDKFKQRAAKWQKLNSGKHNMASINWRMKLRLEVIKEYGGKCVCCGEKIIEFLCIDHIYNDGSKHREQLKKSKSVGAGFYRWLKRKGFPKDRYQLLCYNCNFAKGHYGKCPHQKVICELKG